MQPAQGDTFVRGHALANLLLPSTNQESLNFAIDLNGDGNPDNQFGQVLATLTSVGFNPNLVEATTAAVTAGQIVHLIELRSSDASFASDTQATATWYIGEATLAPPLFDGSDTFRYDPLYYPAEFIAPLISTNFVSANPATTSAPVDFVMKMQVGNEPIPLQLQGARLRFTATATGLAQGQVNGSIQKEEIDAIFVPALAAAFNDIVEADPESEDAETLLGLFDSNPADGTISVEEVATHPVMVTLLTPDVDIRDAKGNYAPNPANTSKDSMSIGFGFTAVTSQTVLPLVFLNGFE